MNTFFVIDILKKYFFYIIKLNDKVNLNLNLNLIPLRKKLLKYMRKSE